MVRFLRKHAATMVVAGVTAGVMAGTPALAHLTESFQHLKEHIDKLSADNHLKYIKQTDTIPASSFGSAEAICPQKWVPTGGGFAPDNSIVDVWRSLPSDATGTGAEGRRGWRVSAFNPSGAQQNVTAYVICAQVDSTSGNVGG